VKVVYPETTISPAACDALGSIVRKTDQRARRPATDTMDWSATVSGQKHADTCDQSTEVSSMMYFV
jgi:hypothetical protein